MHSGVNAFGCCAGPMQFSVIGPGSTWARYGVDGDHDGRKDVYDPADAIPAAARYLVASGAPADYHAAIFAYNHADWYVAEVLAKAAEYRAAAPLLSSAGELGGIITPPSVTVPEILHNPQITLTPIQRADIRSGTLDPRLYATLDNIGAHHSVVITAIRSDHSTYTVDGNVSNHSAGRAFDIGAVDGFLCHETWGAPPRWNDPCGRLRTPTRRHHRPAPIHRAHLLLGPRWPPRPPRLRPRPTIATTSTWDGTRDLWSSCRGRTSGAGRCWPAGCRRRRSACGGRCASCAGRRSGGAISLAPARPMRSFALLEDEFVSSEAPASTPPATISVAAPPSAQYRTRRGWRGRGGWGSSTMRHTTSSKRSRAMRWSVAVAVCVGAPRRRRRAGAPFGGTSARPARVRPLEDATVCAA